MKVKNEYRLKPLNGWMVVRPAMFVEKEKSNIILLQETEDGLHDTEEYFGVYVVRTSEGYKNDKGEFVKCEYKKGDKVTTFPGANLSKVSGADSNCFLMHQDNVIGLWESI